MVSCQYPGQESVTPGFLEAYGELPAAYCESSMALRRSTGFSPPKACCRRAPPRSWGSRRSADPMIHSLRPIQLSLLSLLVFCNAAWSMVLPIEVMGPDGVVETVTMTLNGGGGDALWLRAHNLSYDDKASVRINEGDWIDLRNDNFLQDDAISGHDFPRTLQNAGIKRTIRPLARRFRGSL